MALSLVSCYLHLPLLISSLPTGPLLSQKEKVLSCEVHLVFDYVIFVFNHLTLLFFGVSASELYHGALGTPLLIPPEACVSLWGQLRHTAELERWGWPVSHPLLLVCTSLKRSAEIVEPESIGSHSLCLELKKKKRRRRFIEEVFIEHQFSFRNISGTLSKIKTLKSLLCAQHCFIHLHVFLLHSHENPIEVDAFINISIL